MLGRDQVFFYIFIGAKISPKIHFFLHFGPKLCFFSILKIFALNKEHLFGMLRSSLRKGKFVKRLLKLVSSACVQFTSSFMHFQFHSSKWQWLYLHLIKPYYIYNEHNVGYTGNVLMLLFFSARSSQYSQHGDNEVSWPSRLISILYHRHTCVDIHTHVDMT